MDTFLLKDAKTGALIDEGYAKSYEYAIIGFFPREEVQVLSWDVSGVIIALNKSGHKYQISARS